MIINGVHDRRNGTIGSWLVTPLRYAELNHEHIGRTVVCLGKGGEAQAGSISSWRDGYVFVKYTNGDTAAGTWAQNLHLGVHEIDLTQEDAS